MAKAKGAQTIGKNISYAIDGNNLVLTIDMSQDFGDSKSGKTTIVASTEGNKQIGDVRVGINVYKYKAAKAKAKR